MADPIEIPIALYAQAAAAACVFELKCRMLADNARLGDDILSCSLEKLVDRLTARFATKLTPHDIAILESCQVLRNRLLHLELARHTGKLVSLGEHLERGNVTVLTVGGDGLPVLAQQLQAGSSITVGSPRRVSDTATLSGRVYGWLVESMASGAFEKSESRFHDAMGVLERMFDVLNEEVIVGP